MLALLVLGGLVAMLDRGAYGVDPRLLLATRLLLLPLAFTTLAIVLGWVWGRWLGLAGAIALFPWAFVLTFGLPRGVPLHQQTLALAASVVLFASLTGPSMFAHFEGRTRTDWTGPRMGLVRWTIILNIASVLSLFLFVAVYRYAIQWHVVIPAVLFASLLIGVLLLAKQWTAGLLLVAFSSVLFVPAGTYFVWREAHHTGEMYLFAAAFLPGILAGWACLVVFGRPLWRALGRGARE